MTTKLTLVSNQPVQHTPAVSADAVQLITDGAMKRLFINEDASLVGLLGTGPADSNRQMLARWIEGYLVDAVQCSQPLDLGVLYEELHKALLVAWWDWSDVISEASGE